MFGPAITKRRRCIHRSLKTLDLLHAIGEPAMDYRHCACKITGMLIRFRTNLSFGKKGIRSRFI
jgi:hypothetical protein